MRSKVALLDDYQHVALDAVDWTPVRARADIEVFHENETDQDLLTERLRPFDIVVAMRDRTKFTRALLERLPALRLLVQTGLSNASIDLEAATERGILVCHTDSLRSTTTELTWALILGCARHLTLEDRTIRAGGWQSALGRGVAGRTLSLLGLGQIGAEVARIGAAFGMRTIAWSQNLTHDVAARAGVTLVSKEELFRQADVLSIHVILSARTRGLVGSAEFELMRPSSILVNTSRGPIVDERALLQALKTRKLSAAGLDVFDQEPLPVDHPLRYLDNVIVTPHIGHVTYDNYSIYFRGVVEDIIGYLNQKPLRVLNPELLNRS